MILHISAGFVDKRSNLEWMERDKSFLHRGLSPLQIFSTMIFYCFDALGGFVFTEKYLIGLRACEAQNGLVSNVALWLRPTRPDKHD